MKRKPQELTKDDLVKFTTDAPYGRQEIYSIRDIVQRSEKLPHRIFELKSRSGKVRFAKGLELRLANRKERQEFSA